MPSPELFNLTAKLAIHRYVDNLRPVISNIRKELDRVSTIRLKVDSDQVVAARVQRQLEDLTRGAKRSQSSLSELRTETKANTRETSNFGNAVGLATRRFAAYVAGAGTIYQLSRAVRGGIRELITYEDELSKTAQITQTSIAASQRLGDQVRANAKAYGISSDELLRSSNELLQAGVPIQKLVQSLGLLSKLRLNSQIDDLRDVSQAYIVLDRVFGQNAGEIEASFGKITNVSKRYASETSDIIRSVSVLGSTFKQSGGDINELISTVSAVRDKTRLPASQIANGLKTIFTRISSQPDIIKDLKELGISLEDVDGKFIGPLNAIREIQQALGSLPDTSTKKLEALQKISGTRQVNIGAALFQSLPTNLKILNELQRDNNAITEDAAIAQQALGNRVQKTKEAFYDLFSAISNDSSLGLLTKQTLDLTTGLLSLSKVAAPLAPVLLAGGVAGLAGRFRFQPLAAPRIPNRANVPATTSFVRLGGSSVVNGFGQRRAEPIKAKESIAIAAASQAELTRINQLRIQSEKRIASVLNSQGGRLQSGFGRLQAAAIRASTALEIRLPRAVRAARTGVSGIGGLGRRGVGLAAGAAAVGAELAGSNPGAQAVGTGAGAGLLLAGLGLNPFAAAIAGVTIGVLRFGSALEESRRLTQEQNAIDAASRVGSALKQTGSSVSPIALNEFRALFASIETQRQKALELPTRFESLTAQIGGLFKGKLTATLQDAADEIAAGRRQSLVSSNKGVEDSLIQLRNEIVDNVTTFAEFKKFGGGIGEQLLRTADVLDDVVLNNSSTLAESTKALIEQKQKLGDVNAALTRTATVANNAALSIDKTARFIAVPNRLRNPLTPESALPTFNLASLGSASFGDAAARLPIGQQEKSLLAQLNKTSSLLPDILAKNRSSFTATNFRELIGDELKQANLGAEIVQAIARQLDKTSFDALSQSLDDVGGTAEQLLSPFNAAIESSRNLGRSLEDAAQRELQNLTDVFSQRRRAGQATRQAQTAHLEVIAQQRGFLQLPTQAGQFDAIVRGQAKTVAGSDSVAGLGAQLKRFEAEFAAGENKLGPAINATVDALRLLADSSSRLSDVQKRLGEVERSRAGKLGLLENFFGSDRSGRAQINQELVAAKAVTQRGSILGLPPQVQQLALRGLNNLGDVENALGTRFTGQQLKEKLLAQAGGQFLGPENNQAKTLQEKTLSTMQDAATAQRELADFEARLQVTFLQQLGQENRAFLSGLGNVLGKPVQLPPSPQFSVPQVKVPGPRQIPNPARQAAIGIEPPAAATTRAEILRRRRAAYETSVLEKSLHIPRNRTEETYNLIEASKLREQGFSDESIKAMRELKREFFEKEKENVERFGDAAKLIPSSIQLEGQHQLTVHVTGLSGIELEGALGNLVESKVAEAIRRLFPAASVESGMVVKT